MTCSAVSMTMRLYCTAFLPHQTRRKYFMFREKEFQENLRTNCLLLYRLIVYAKETLPCLKDTASNGAARCMHYSTPTEKMNAKPENMPRNLTKAKSRMNIGVWQKSPGAIIKSYDLSFLCFTSQSRLFPRSWQIVRRIRLFEYKISIYRSRQGHLAAGFYAYQNSGGQIHFLSL